MDIIIVSVAYRLAPEHPFPAPLDDCDTALKWLFAQSEILGVNPERIAIGGQSAGGGLAAALAQRTYDEARLAPVFQLLVYPMLDAATTIRSNNKGTGRFIWTPKSNSYGWQSYLGADPASGSFRAYSVPATRLDLAGLPPAWIGVGTLDLFHDENLDYAEKLKQAGVACELYVTPGAYHGFDIFRPKARASREFHASIVAALKTALLPGP